MATQGSSMLSDTRNDKSFGGSNVIRGGIVTFRLAGTVAPGGLVDPSGFADVVDVAIVVVVVVEAVVVVLGEESFCANDSWHTTRVRTVIQPKTSAHRLNILNDFDGIFRRKKGNEHQRSIFN